MITGRSAPLRRAIAASTPSAAGASTGLGRYTSASDGGPSMKTWSSGKSMNVGPVGGSSAASNARSTMPGISAVGSAVAASLVSGLTNGTWSISWSDPIPHRMAGARPPRTSTGLAFICAEAIALMPLVTPGPAVSAQTPGSRVALAQPSAAKAAACSWRVATVAMPSPRQPALIGKRGPPGSGNSLETPWAPRRLATSLPPWSAVAFSVSVDTGAQCYKPGMERELDGDFGGTFPFEPRWAETDDLRLHYVDEGDGPTLLMVHGNP